MLRTTKVFALAIAVALVALASFAGSASATRTATFAPAGAISATPSGKLTFDASGRQAICNVTMNGNMERTAVTIAGGTIGTISAVRIAECNGEVTIERALVEARTAWRITSDRILGTLPEAITGAQFTIRAAKFAFTAFFGIVRCLYEGNAGALARTTRTGASRYSINSARADETSRFAFISGSEACPPSGRMAGSFNITAQTITFA